MSVVNTTYNCGGRLGNSFFRNFIASFIAKNNNLKFEYENEAIINKLGIFFHKGQISYETSVIVTDEFVDKILTDEIFFELYVKNRNVIFKQNQTWCQTPVVAKYIRDNIDYESIFKNNKYRDRYNNNDDFFVHVRLGDIVSSCFNSSYEYYDKVLSSYTTKTGYISSDTIDHEICKKLIEKYNLSIVNYDETDTILFGSTCKYIVLSQGTFSWMIGVMAPNSIVNYPEIKKVWLGDIFIFDDWNKVLY